MPPAGQWSWLGSSWNPVRAESLHRTPHGIGSSRTYRRPCNSRARTRSTLRRFHRRSAGVVDMRRHVFFLSISGDLFAGSRTTGKGRYADSKRPGQSGLPGRGRRRHRSFWGGPAPSIRALAFFHRMSGQQRAGGRALRRGRGCSRGRGGTAPTTHCNHAVVIRLLMLPSLTMRPARPAGAALAAPVRYCHSRQPPGNRYGKWLPYPRGAS